MPRDLAMNRTLAVAAALVCVLLTAPRASHAQHLRRSDVVGQDDLGSRGLASDSICVGAGSTVPGVFDPGPTTMHAPASRIHLAAAGIASAERLRRREESASWRGGALGELRAHLARGCHFDGYVRATGGAGGVGADAVAVAHLPGALGGALHAFVEVAAAGDSTASDRTDVPRGAALGVAYTTFNLLRLIPVFRSPEGRPRLDIRARLSASALHEYAGDARRLHGKSVVPEYSATTMLVVHEVINSSILYTARAIPGWIAPAANRSSASRTLWEQDVVLDHAIIARGTSWLSRHEPFVGARYSWRQLGSRDERHELALHAGVHLF